MFIQNEVEAPRLARPAFVGYLAGGRQEFVVDRVRDAAVDRRLRSEGKIIVRRRPAGVV